MSLLTGSVIHRYSWTCLPAPDDVLARVKQIAVEQNQPQVARNFKYRNDGGDLADVAETITNENNQIVLQEHPIDDNADDHNEIVEWQNDNAHEGEEAIIAVENDRHNDEANNIIEYLENGPANLTEENRSDEWKTKIIQEMIIRQIHQTDI